METWGIISAKETNAVNPISACFHLSDIRTRLYVTNVTSINIGKNTIFAFSIQLFRAFWKLKLFLTSTTKRPCPHVELLSNNLH